MIYSGIDIVEVKRIEKLIKNESFLKKIYSSNEIEYLISRKYAATTAAGIFSAKEAVSKCLGTGVAGFAWTEIEIAKDKSGKPIVELTGRALKLSRDKGITNIDVSITHINEYAVASAIAEVVESYGVNIGHVDIPHRKLISHKGNFGKVGVIAGKIGMSGSAYFSSLAALKSGSGLVYSINPNSIFNTLSLKFNEIILEKLEKSMDFFVEEDFDLICRYSKKLDVLVLGPGLGTDESTASLVKKLLLNIDKPIVLDADGLNCISGDTNILKDRKFATVITPHNGEMSKLCNDSLDFVEKNRVNIALEFSKKHNVITVLKGYKTIITDGFQLYVNDTGNPGMATAGSGDILTGIISSFIGQGFNVFEASKIGVHIHGLAGDLAKEKYGEYGMIASNILEFLPISIKLFEKIE